MKRVEGKVAVITGGAMGMGNGAAQVLAREGAKVVLIDYSDKGQESAQKIIDAGGEAIAYKVDVRDGERLKEIYNEVYNKYGSLDILVNAAGIGIQRSFFKSDGEFLERTMGINFMGVWNSCQAALPNMLKNGYGKIVNFASVTGVMVVDPCMTAYAATKGAIMALTKALAVEFASRKVTVNAILPGVIDTPMMHNTCVDACPEDPQSIKDGIASTVPIGRLGTTEEAGKVVLFLASDDSSYVTGTSIVFDGASTIPESAGSGWQPQEDE